MLYIHDVVHLHFTMFPRLLSFLEFSVAPFSLLVALFTFYKLDFINSIFMQVSPAPLPVLGRPLRRSLLPLTFL